MNDNEEVPNPQLRAYVTEQSFVLTLGRSHIRTLAYLVRDYGRARPDPWKQTLEELRAERGESRHFVTAMCGLGRRGLVEHRKNPNWRGKSGTGSGPLSDYYRLTRAGWAAYDLLAEAGMVPAVNRRSGKRRLVA